MNTINEMNKVNVYDVYINGATTNTSINNENIEVVDNTAAILQLSEDAYGDGYHCKSIIPSRLCNIGGDNYEKNIVSYNNFSAIMWLYQTNNNYASV